jgi:hypothetical protein
LLTCIREATFIGDLKPGKYLFIVNSSPMQF